MHLYKFANHLISMVMIEQFNLQIFFDFKFWFQGYLKATTDLRKYVTGDDWVEFAWVDMLTLTGGGTFDGQGAASWPYNKCPTNKNCRLLPTVKLSNLIYFHKIMS